MTIFPNKTIINAKRDITYVSACNQNITSLMRTETPLLVNNCKLANGKSGSPFDESWNAAFGYLQMILANYFLHEGGAAAKKAEQTRFAMRRAAPRPVLAVPIVGRIRFHSLSSLNSVTVSRQVARVERAVERSPTLVFVAVALCLMVVDVRGGRDGSSARTGHLFRTTTRAPDITQLGFLRA